MHQRPTLPGWWWVLPAIGAVRIVAWLLLAGWEAAPSGPVVSLALVAGFGASGWLLISVGRPQPTPARLGAIFLLTGSALADEGGFLAAGGAPLLILASLRPSLFLPAFFWSLASDFPRLRRAEGQTNPAPRIASLTFALCAAPFLATLVYRRAAWSSAPPPSGAGLAESWGWGLVYVLSLAALGYMAWTSRHASREERRRVRLFLGGVIAGSAPALGGSLILLASPPLLDLVRSTPRYERAFLLAAYGGLAVVPFVTFYAVLVHHALGLRGAARSTIRALLARQTGWLLIGSPLAVGLWVLLSGSTWPSRGVGSPSMLALTASFALGALALTRRRRILSFVDRHFFPDQHEIDEEVDRLLDGLPSRRSIVELSATVVTAVEEVLGLRSGHLLVFDPNRHELRAARGEVAPLAVSRDLRRRLETGELVDVRFGDAETLAWSADTGVEHLVSLGVSGSGDASEGLPLGAIGVGRTLSGLPLSPDGRRRLARVARAVGDTLRRLDHESTDHTGALRDSPDLAGRCPRCEAIAPLSERTCGPCGTPLVALELPYILSGRYRVESWLGAGGLGVVYEGRDLALDRPVALKTLPAASPQRIVELQREARFMGRLSHPALATIHGLEVWSGVPVLVLEYFAAGTLHDLLAREPLPWRDALEAGVHLAGGLRYLHAKGAIHGDVKPRNIGVSSEGPMKIMDFGISRLIADGTDASAMPVTATSPDASSAERLRGTTLYLPPELLEDREEPGPAVDLWALSITLYEAIAGCHPFRAGSLSSSVAQILLRDAPDLRSHARRCPAPVAEFFQRALSRTASDRPATAGEWVATVRPLLGT